MKTLLLWAVVILSCSCHQAVTDNQSRDSRNTMNRRDEVRKIILDFSGEPADPSFEVEVVLRGPLTFSQIEKELTELNKPSREISKVEGREGPATGRAWARVKSKYKEGDELYFYLLTEKPGYSQFSGWLLIRRSEIVDGIPGPL